MSRGPVDEGQASDELPRFELVVTVQLLYVVVQLAERYNSLDVKGLKKSCAVTYLPTSRLICSVGEDGRSSRLLLCEMLLHSKIIIQQHPEVTYDTDRMNDTRVNLKP